MLTWISNFPYNAGQSGTWCKKSSYEKFGETIRFVEHSPDAAAWPWPTHQTALLNYGGDDAATLRYCPDAVKPLLLLCLFLKIPALMLRQRVGPTPLYLHGTSYDSLCCLESLYSVSRCGWLRNRFPAFRVTRDTAAHEYHSHMNDSCMRGHS